MMKHANEQGCKVNELGLEPSDIWWLASLIEYNVLDRTKTSKVINHVVEFGGEVKETITELGLWPTLDSGLEEMVDEVIANNPKVIEQILAGKKKAIGSLIGQLKQVDKNIDSKEAMEILNDKLSNIP